MLQNYDEFASLKALQNLNVSDAAAVATFKAEHYLADEQLAALQTVQMPTECRYSRHCSTYNDIRIGYVGKNPLPKKQISIDWDDVAFEVDLLKSYEINRLYFGTHFWT